LVHDDPRTILSLFAAIVTRSAFATTTDEPNKKYFNVGASMLFVLLNE
jgi:hypothetical protein